MRLTIAQENFTGGKIMIKKLSKFIGEYKFQTIITPILVALEVVMEVLIPLLMADLIDKGIYAGEMNTVYKIGIEFKYINL